MSSNDVLATVYLKSYSRCSWENSESKLLQNSKFGVPWSITVAHDEQGGIGTPNPVYDGHTVYVQYAGGIA